MNMEIIMGTLMVTSSFPMGMVPSFSWADCFLFSAGMSAIASSPFGGSSLAAQSAGAADGCARRPRAM